MVSNCSAQSIEYAFPEQNMYLAAIVPDDLS